MDRIWVRNINTNDIDKVGSLSFGADNWQAAYSEMIERGYEFQVGTPEGNYTQRWGLYLVNPLDIKIKQSKYSVVNDLNELIKQFQDSVNERKPLEKQKSQKHLLDDLFEQMESAYARVKYTSGVAMMFAPEGAIDSSIEDQKNAYNQFIESMKASTAEEREGILERVFASQSLTDNAKLAIAMEVLKSLGKLSLKDEKGITR